MTLSLQLDDDQSRRLEELAHQLQIAPQELAKIAIDDFVGRSAKDFESALRHVLEKNRELYRRLA